ncbi:MAG: cadherin-like domain-containing protein, partial [Gammaproteobacteria bacterium]|nr:cadherin-like domain-containing protein [Gammaproteobacteria bacterium]NNL50000.1 cadherin-like domain-containing protein [Woeseiaceae bacterium]
MTRITGVRFALLLFVLLVPLATVFAQPVPTAYWQLDEGAGTTTADAIGNNDGTLVGTSWGTGVSAAALDFNGSNDYVSIADSPALDFSSWPGATVALWAKPGQLNAANDQTLYGHWNAPGKFRTFQVLITVNNRWQCRSNHNNGSIDSTSVATLGEWTHVACAWSPQGLTVYVDGVAEATDTAVQGSLDANSGLHTFGAREKNGSMSRFFTGTLDEIQIYDLTLSDAEVFALYEAMAPGVNTAPTADEQAVSTAADTPLAITLTGSDPESDPLTFAIAAAPSNGSLSGTAPDVTYTPNGGYVGADSFTFTVDDGEFTSVAASVSITVTAVNTAPTADEQAVSTAADTPLAITLTGSDPESDPLTFAIASAPSNGSLSGTAPDVTYTPNGGYVGADSFTFTVDDGEFTSVAASVSITVTSPPLDADGTLWIPYLEWELQDTSWSGNPFDVIASATFVHTASGRTHTTEMFYSGNNSWKFRFSGTEVGEWTFTTVSDDIDLDGENGTVNILPNSAPEARGFVSNNGTRWTWSGSSDAFVPQLVMYAMPDFFFENPAQVDADINTFIVEHGFNGFHIPGANYWFDIDKKHSDDIAVPDPDPRTFEALEMFITKVYEAGGTVHIWAWGDEADGQTPTPWGLNGAEDQRLQRYIAARLGPLPGWTMGYGSDLDEWVTEAELGTWVTFMHEHLGWPHLLGARASGPNTDGDHVPFLGWNAQMDYSSYEHHRPSYDVYVNALNALPGQAVFSEDRFRIRDNVFPLKDYTMELTRRGLWHSTMAGGVANIWGHDPNYPAVNDGFAPSAAYPNPEVIQTYSTFFATRYGQDVTRCNNLTDGYALCYPGNEQYIFYKEDSDSIQIDLSAMATPQSAKAVDTASIYQEIDLGVLTAANQTWQAPYVSDWAVAVGDFGQTRTDSTPPSVPQGLSGTALSDSEIMLDWQAATDPRSGVSHYVVYRYGVEIGTSTSLSFTDANLTALTSYTYTVTAVNNANLESSFSEAITLTTLQAPPVADAGGPYSGDEGSGITLDGSGSTDADDDIVAYEWDFDGDDAYNDASGVNATYNAVASGVYTIGLRVTDGAGASDTATATVTVNNVAPTADAGGPYDGLVGIDVVLDASASSDPGNDIVAYDWDLNNDGSYDDASGISTTFNSAASGAFLVGLRVTDADGAIDAATATISVGQQAPAGSYYPPPGESVANQFLSTPGEVGLSASIVTDLGAVITAGRWALWRHGYLV